MNKRKSTKYLNNKDMMREIHKSKLSYCYTIDNRYTQYDIIVDDISDINEKNIQEAKKVRASQLSNARYDQEISQWHINGASRSNKPKQSDFRVEPEDINIEDLVFRVMTYEHIPKTPNRKKNPKTEADLHTKINFPPFKHYAFVDGELREVLRSHWKEGLDNGTFCQTHGSLTKELAMMMMKLVERYAMRGNWRNYTYNSEMQGAALLQLSEVGLKFNEARSSNPFSYYTATITNSFTRVLNLEKRNQNIRDDMLQDNGYLPSFKRQLEDETSQKKAIEADEENYTEELKKHGYNIV